MTGNSMWLAGSVLLVWAQVAQAADYLREIKPLLQTKCYACHGAVQQKAKLRVDTAKFIKQGGESGSAIMEGKPDDSLFFKVLAGTGDIKMPPEGEAAPLTADELKKVREWIASGAPVPDDEKSQIDPKRYWSYVVPTAPPIPAIKNANWGRTPIDAFVASEHEQRGLQTSPATSKNAWLRRVYIDLIGLPPTRDQLLAYLNDTDPKADEKVVESLLASPQYGERWGRHWMDIWRYSDWYGSRGINEIRYSQRHIWRWRDWIVDSLNNDKGYDRMVLEMLAADELSPGDPAMLPATGFLGRNWYKFDRNVWMFETVERTAEAFLGLTLRCARCHDHKYDPITQTEYYQFRAVFEPHQVRTDPISALIGTEKDATLGQVLKDGIPRVFDKDANVPTYRFIRGDDRMPDKSTPLSPAAPHSLGGPPLKVEAVSLPVSEFYPALRDGVRQTFLAKADADISGAQQAVPSAVQKIEAAKKQLTELEQRAAEADSVANSNPQTPKGIFLKDNFEKPRPDVWQILDGDWVYENGRLMEKAVTSFATIVTKQPHPESFKARIKYRTLAPGSYRSIGFSFDFQDKGQSQDVYTSAGDARQTVQAFHRLGGKQEYPAAGIKDVKLKVGDETTVEFTVKGSRLVITLNGRQELDYVMPTPRKLGKFALWAHSGSAEFLECEITELAASREQLVWDVRHAEHEHRVALLKVEIATAEKASLQARVAAELAKHTTPPSADASSLALAASRAERAVVALNARHKVLEAEFQLSKLKPIEPATSSPSEVTDTTTNAAAIEATKAALTKAMQDAEKKLADARSEFDKATAAIDAADGKYQPLGETFPQQSTGRRLALARWIVHPENPRTARVAVNHLWSRHFGQPLVATTENFGLNGAQPTHPELLDWLAVQLVQANWRLKPLHRLIVLSATYRQSTSDRDSDNQRIDPNNHYLWRMNSRRMEAEVVRDSVLSLAGTLDVTRGGPEIPESQGQTSKRRSLYFRNTPNEKMPFLEVFDVADPNSCYRRKESVIPQQALAVMNSALAQDHARHIAEQLTKPLGDSDDAATRDRFIQATFEHLLSRVPTTPELDRCRRFLSDHPQLIAAPGKTSYTGNSGTQRAPATAPALRAREALVQVLLLHNDFVTVR